MDSKNLILKIKIITGIILMCPFLSKSQDLQFNQVILVSEQMTIPEGMAWKITNVLPEEDFDDGRLGIIVNNFNITVAYSISSNGQTSSSGNFSNNHNYYNGLSGPYWLPQGTTVAPGENTKFISVIEFNTQ